MASNCCRGFRAGSGSDIFEFTTALAFHHFAECQVDVVVLEVGLGGRFDATNVVEPLAAAITTIGLDHEAYLGSTTETIAMEKSRDHQAGVPVVLGRMVSRFSSNRRALFSTVGAPVLRLDRDFRCEDPRRLLRIQVSDCG